MKARQGKRARDKWGPCKECGRPTTFRCAACGSWRCAIDTGFGIHLRFRKQPNAPTGYYRARCFPSCRKRMTSEVAERVKTSPGPRAPAKESFDAFLPEEP